VLRVSKPRAVICLAGDLGKGILAILLFYRAADPVSVAWILGMAVMLGHCYSPFLKFNGGKGVATSTGVMLVLYPLLAVPCICAYVIFRIIGRKVFHWAEEGAISSLTSWASGTLSVPTAGTIDAPLLGAVTWSTLSLGQGAQFNAPVLTTLTGSTLTLRSGRTLNAPAFTAIDNARFLLSDGAQLAVAATSYSATGRTGSATLFSATGTGTLLDLSSVTSFNGRFNDGRNTLHNLVLLPNP
jgi:hypothetical protein